MIITIKHTKAVGYCNAGLRRWFEGRDLSFGEFVMNGASDEWFMSQGDAMADRLVDFARSTEKQMARGE